MQQIQLLISLSILLPFLACVSNVVLNGQKNLRDTVTFIISLITFLLVVMVCLEFNDGNIADLTLFSVMPGLDIAFKVEPLGLLFALIASGLWIVTHVYAIGYMRGNNEKHHSRFFACFSLAIGTTLGLAFSKNLFTLFIFYELLTLSTFPLVAHKGTAEALRGAKTYLAILLGTSVGFQLLAIIAVYFFAGTLDFTPQGVLRGSVSNLQAATLLALFAFGVGKAALMPFHRWLPAAMVAPTPVSALLHAVAVVKAGVFTILKVGIYIFGIDFMSVSGISDWLIWLATFSILAASIIAITKDNLKARLAYSTVSQLSYITLGVALADSLGAIAGGLHIATHAFGKITLFMCAGSIYIATHKTNISDMSGLGRKMPITFAAFCIGALSIIGLPPFAGSWSKWLLVLSAIETEYIVIVAALMISSLLNVYYLLSVVSAGFFGVTVDRENDPSQGIQEAPIFCWLPTVVTAVGCFLLFFYAGGIREFLIPITMK
ncbi:MAG: monovalent cation/H+ antiporter subunit D family protein [Pseudomonadota bacterium]|nr:monovalent cation/H+ antiporter subunit D family protein [Pseudomonadota bacterium]